ncbi:hypothetical protein GCM10028821_26320 [Hymenobacter jeollabukensis]
MWHWLLASLLLGFGLPAAAQTPEKTAESTVPDTVRSTLTARHRRVPGSTFYVQAAPGYAPEESLNGLARPDGSLLEVLRVSEGNFLKIRGLVVEQYLAGRAKEVRQHELQFNGYPAVFGEGASLEPGKDLMMLAFGDSASFTLVFGLYPDNDAAAEAELRQMLLTGYYDPQGQVPPLELAPFVLSLTGTPYQLLEVRRADKTYVFGPAGSAGAVPDTFATRFSVQVLPPLPAEEARLRLLRLVRALTTPGATLQSQERQLPSGSGYEVSGSSTLRGRRNSFYQLIRTDEDATLIFHGVVFGPPASAAKPAPKNPVKGKVPTAKPAAVTDPVADFRKVAATLRMKR